MDKFGIFNLLSSLFGQSAGLNDGKEPLSAPDFSGEKEGTDAAATRRANSPPLQNSMLCTMKNHDEFVKRVHAQRGKRDGRKDG